MRMAFNGQISIVAGVGRKGVEKLLEFIAEGEDERVPPAAHECLMALAAQLAITPYEGPKLPMAKEVVCHQSVTN